MAGGDVAPPLTATRVWLREGGADSRHPGRSQARHLAAGREWAPAALGLQRVEAAEDEGRAQDAAAGARHDEPFGLVVVAARRHPREILSGARSRGAGAPRGTAAPPLRREGDDDTGDRETRPASCPPPLKRCLEPHARPRAPPQGPGAHPPPPAAQGRSWVRRVLPSADHLLGLPLDREHQHDQQHRGQEGRQHQGHPEPAPAPYLFATHQLTGPPGPGRPHIPDRAALGGKSGHLPARGLPVSRNISGVPRHREAAGRFRGGPGQARSGAPGNGPGARPKATCRIAAPVRASMAHRRSSPSVFATTYA